MTPYSTITQDEVYDTLYCALPNGSVHGDLRRESAWHAWLSAQLTKGVIHGSFYLSCGRPWWVGSLPGGYTAYWMQNRFSEFLNCFAVKRESNGPLEPIITSKWLKYRKDQGYRTCLFGEHRLFTPIVDREIHWSLYYKDEPTGSLLQSLLRDPEFRAFALEEERQAAGNLETVVVTSDPDVAILEQPGMWQTHMFVSTCWLYPTRQLLEPLARRDVILALDDQKHIDRARHYLREFGCRVKIIEPETHA